MISFYLLSIVRIQQRIVRRLDTIDNFVREPGSFKSCCIPRTISFKNYCETIAAAGDWDRICFATSLDNQTPIRIINCKKRKKLSSSVHSTLNYFTINMVIDAGYVIFHIKIVKN